MKKTVSKKILKMLRTIPEQLRKCFNDLDFIAGIKDNQKVCFKKRYYVKKDDWFGALWRTFDSECLIISGIAEIQSICKITLDLYGIYINDPDYGEELVDKIISARKGLMRLTETYKSLGKIVECDTIRNSAIIDLDKLIPMDRKISEGFVTRYKRDFDAETMHSQKRSISDVIEDENIAEI